MSKKIDFCILQHIERIADHFGFVLTPDNRGFSACCPIHDGSDNPSAFHIFADSATVWCFSRHCFEGQNKMIDLLRLLLQKYNNIECDNAYTASWFVEHILEGKNIPNIPQSTLNRAKVDYTPKVFYQSPEEWWEFAGQPSKHYIKIGFPADIVSRYLIGEVSDKSHRFYNRVVVPQLNKQWQIIGYTGRSMYKQCSKCKLYHSPNAPCPTEHKSSYNKWHTIFGFKVGYSLYNDWTIPDKVEEINLVESVGNTLRAVESHFANTLGLYGNTLKQGQVDKLEQMGVKRINMIVDNDTNGAGLNGALRSQKKYKQFMFKIITSPTNDIAEMKREQLFRFLRKEGVKCTL